MPNSIPFPTKSIEEQILQAERNYKAYLQNDAEFEVLKEIRLQIKMLKAARDSSSINDLLLPAVSNNE